MHTIYLALGSNIGNKEEHITQAIMLLEKKITNIVRAPLYATKPWGYIQQDDFLNTALKGETTLSPQALLRFVKEIEAKGGRVNRFKNGPREIDIDILFYDDVIYKDNTLQIPHPGMQDREFVLYPLADIAPDIMHPVSQKTIRELLQAYLRRNNPE